MFFKFVTPNPWGFMIQFDDCAIFFQMGFWNRQDFTQVTVTPSIAELPWEAASHLSLAPPLKPHRWFGCGASQTLWTDDFFHLRWSLFFVTSPNFRGIHLYGIYKIYYVYIYILYIYTYIYHEKSTMSCTQICQCVEYLPTVGPKFMVYVGKYTIRWAFGVGKSTSPMEPMGIFIDFPLNLLWVTQGLSLAVLDAEVHVSIFVFLFWHQHLQRGAKWFLKGVNSPSLRV